MPKPHQPAGSIEVDDAVAACLRLADRHPGDPNIWFDLGRLLRAARRFDEALAAYARAIGAGLERPQEAHVNRAAILIDYDLDPIGAERELATALALDPNFIPAWINLGQLHEDLGQAAAARATYRSLLAIDPENGRAHARLALIDVASGAPDRAVAALRPALDRATATDSRAEILFALAAALDAAGDYRDAFQAAQAANWLAASLAARRYDPAAQERLVDRLIETFPLPPTAKMLRSAGPTPLFIVGMFRSGSTLFEQIVARHPDIVAGGEREYIPALVSARLHDYPAGNIELNSANLTQFRQEYLKELGAGDQAFVTDKRCDNFQHIGLVRAIFPQAPVIATRRHPLDTLLSIYFLHFGDGVTYGHDLREAAHYYSQYHRLMEHWRCVFPGSIVDVDYDQLILDPGSTMRRVVDLLGLPWSDEMMESRDTGAVRTASNWAVRQPLHARSIGRWRNYEAYLGEATQILKNSGIAT